MVRCIAILGAVFVAVAPAVSSAAEEPGLAGLRQRYEQAAIELVGWETDQQKAAADQYGSFLDRARQELQQKGDLDGYLAVQSEQKRLDQEKTIPTKTGSAAHPLISAARSGYASTVADAKRKREQRFEVLTSRYIETLDALKKSLTVSGKLPEAIAVRDEMDRVKKLIETAPKAESDLSHGAAAAPPPGQEFESCGECGGIGKRRVTCSACSGTGRCTVCSGRGMRPGGIRGREHDEVICMRCKKTGKCTACSGTGNADAPGRCGACGGSGKVAIAVAQPPRTAVAVAATPATVPVTAVEDPEERARLRSALARELTAGIEMTYRLRQRFVEENVQEADLAAVMSDPSAHVGKVLRSRCYLAGATARSVVLSALPSGVSRATFNTYSKAEGDQAAALVRPSNPRVVWVTYGVARPDLTLVFKTEAAE